MEVTVETDVRAAGDRLADDRFALTVADTGPGVPSLERAVLQEGTETELAHSQGIGLWSCNWLLRQAGGSLSFEDCEDGARVTAVVPVESA